MVLDLFNDPPASGEDLMARDAELLERSASDQLAPQLRFYRWIVPTVSLGYHQKPDLLDGERLEQARIPWVRRPTGGAAVLHSEELTYAVVIPHASDAVHSNLVQEFVGKAIASGLQAVGVNATIEERGEPLAALPNRTSCFVRTSKWEVSVGGKKLVGSAQRKLQHAILQHGSILEGDDHLRIIDFIKLSNEAMRVPLRERLREHSTSISTQLGHNVDDRVLREALAESFREQFRHWPEG
jgi:lipoyl(octanoyl) transferase